MMKASTLVLVLLVVILLSSVTLSFGYPKILKKISANGKSSLQSRGVSSDGDEHQGRYINANKKLFLSMYGFSKRSVALLV